jgi:hypothetical protein
LQCSRSYPAGRFRPAEPPRGANRRMHAIEAELFHKAILARHICLGVIHRLPHGPIATCCARLRLCGPAQTLPMAPFWRPRAGQAGRRLAEWQRELGRQGTFGLSPRRRLASRPSARSIYEARPARPAGDAPVAQLDSVALPKGKSAVSNPFGRTYVIVRRGARQGL